MIVGILVTICHRRLRPFAGHAPRTFTIDRAPMLKYPHLYRPGTNGD
jgi:hypothetical protein